MHQHTVRTTQKIVDSDVFNGVQNTTFGIVGTIGSVAYIGASGGTGAMIGGTSALIFSLGEVGIGLGQILDAFGQGRNEKLHNSSSIPGLIAYYADYKYASSVDAAGQFIPIAMSGGFSDLNIIGGFKNLSSENVTIYNTLNKIDAFQDVKGFALETIELATKTGYDKKIKQVLSYSFSHTVQKGQTLTEIANTYGTTVDDIVKQNNISNPDDIKAGQKVHFSGGSFGGAGASGIIEK